MGVPVLSSCCFCLSLRKGILTYNYIKLVLLLLAVIIMFMTKNEINDVAEKNDDDIVQAAAKITDVLTYLVLVMFLLDLPFTICALVGAHKEKVNLIKVFYYYTFVGVIFYIIFLVLQIYSGSMKQVAQTLIGIALTVYMLLVARSEILRLKGGNIPDPSEQPMKGQNTAYPGA